MESLCYGVIICYMLYAMLCYVMLYVICYYMVLWCYGVNIKESILRWGLDQVEEFLHVQKGDSKTNLNQD